MQNKRISSFLKNARQFKSDLNNPASRSKPSSRLMNNGDPVKSPVSPIDELIAECSRLISDHEKAKKILQSYGEKTVGDKVRLADEIVKNENTINDLTGKIDGLNPQIDNFNEKENELLSLKSKAKKLYEVIKDRKESKKHLIPFYGVKYALETKDLINDYNSLAKKVNTLNGWISENISAHNMRKKQVKEMSKTVEQLKDSNKKMEKEGGVVCRLLTIINRLIAAFSKFKIGINSVKGDLQFSYADSLEETNALINESTKSIELHSTNLMNFINESAIDIPGEVMGQVRTLIA